jgi:hypothetical protein
LAVTSLRRSVTSKEASVPYGRPQSAAGVFPLRKGRMFSSSRFSSSFKSSEGLAPFVALDPAFRAPISTDVVRPQASKWRIRRNVIPSPAYEQRVGARHKRADCRKITSAPWPERVSNLISTDGRQPFVPAASATPVCFEPILRSPFFSRRNGRPSALIGAPPSSDGEEHNTNIGRLSRQFAGGSH